MRLDNAVRGLADDCGEVCGAVKKFIEYGKPLDLTNLKEEVGDVLWRLAQICEATKGLANIDFGDIFPPNGLLFSLEDAMEANIRKLQVRYPEKYSDEQAAEENRDRTAEAKAVGLAKHPDDMSTKEYCEADGQALLRLKLKEREKPVSGDVGEERKRVVLATSDGECHKCGVICGDFHAPTCPESSPPQAAGEGTAPRHHLWNDNGECVDCGDHRPGRLPHCEGKAQAAGDAEIVAKWRAEDCDAGYMPKPVAEAMLREIDRLTANFNLAYATAGIHERTIAARDAELANLTAHCDNRDRALAERDAEIDRLTAPCGLCGCSQADADCAGCEVNALRDEKATLQSDLADARLEIDRLTKERGEAQVFLDQPATLSQIPVLTDSVHGYLASEVSHDVREDAARWDRNRWNNRTVAILLKAVTARDAELAALRARLSPPQAEETKPPLRLSVEEVAKCLTICFNTVDGRLWLGDASRHDAAEKITPLLNAALDRKGAASGENPLVGAQTNLEEYFWAYDADKNRVKLPYIAERLIRSPEEVWMLRASGGCCHLYPKKCKCLDNQTIPCEQAQ